MIYVKANVPDEPLTYGAPKENAQLLKQGEVYTVYQCKPSSSHCEVFLMEFPGVAFNSIWFEKPK